MKLLGQEAIAAIVRSLMAGGDLADAIDAMDDCCDYLRTPWTLGLWAHAVALKGALLFQHPDRRADEGPRHRSEIRRCISELETFLLRDLGATVVRGDIAMLAASRSLLDLADDNLIGAVTFVERALRLARDSGDRNIEHLVLRIRARIFDSMGDSDTAAAFVVMAERLNPPAPAPVWLHLDVWLNLNKERKSRAA